MDFLDKLGKKASQTYKYTTEKTSKLAKEAKLKMDMSNKKDEIEEIYVEIGKKVYQNHISAEEIDIDISLELEEYCIQIDELSDRIEEDRKELLSLKNKKQCENCYYEIESDYNYCPNCGIVQEKEELEEQKQENTEQNEQKVPEQTNNIIEEE